MRNSSQAFARSLIAALLVLLANSAAAATDAPRPVRIAVLAYQGAEDSGGQWSHVAAYLARAIPERRFDLLHVDLSEVPDLVRQERVDFVLTNSGQYVVLEAELGLSRILTLNSPQVPSPDRALGSAVIVQAERTDLRALGDLRGKSVAAVSPSAFGGYLVAARELVRAGVDLEDGEARLVFVGLPMQRIVDAVDRGDVDAGIIRSCLLESLASRGQLAAGRFRVLGAARPGGFPCEVSTALYPDWPLAKARHTDLALAKAVATALLSMPQSADGFSWAVPADYQPVHDLYRELKTGPYAYLREATLDGLARRYWHYVLVVFFVLAAFIVHLVRVEHLVKRRTAELSSALAARERAEARVRAHQEQAEHLSRLSILGELAGTLAHEINQPLTTIGTYSQSLERRIAAGNVDLATFAEVNLEIGQQADRAGAIVQRIRNFAKKRAAVREPRSLHELAQEAAALFTAMMPSLSRLRIENRLGDATPVRADPLQIQEVLLNLMKNAADATADLPPERRTITVRLEAEGPWFKISVVDRGPGLASGVREKLFEPFFTTKRDGLGLGLSICKTIVEAHGGRIWAERNETGSGLTFRLTLPREVVSAA